MAVVFPRITKGIRTVQSELPFLKGPKDFGQLMWRRALHRPHDADFNALSLIRDHIAGSYVDIGGNQGQSIESLRLLVPNANIVSFEANPLLSRKLASRYLGDPYVDVRAVGLGMRPGRLVLHVPTYRGFVYDGLASLDPEAARSWINADRVYFFRPDHLTVQAVTCEIQTLDSQALRPAFIKIDVQGTEYEVVQGGVETINTHQPILMVEDYLGDPRLPTLMEGLGYSAFIFDGRRFTPHWKPTNNSFLLPRSRLQALKDLIL